LPVTVRITPNLEGPVNVIRVDGWLTAEETAELERAIGDLGHRVTLDLAELRSADRAAVEVLRSLRERGTELRNASPMIALLLESGRSPMRR
jgi:hypothetical protein